MVGMPTPYEESHVGYDAKLGTNGYVRFFQFKRPDYLGAGRGTQGQYYPNQPYYRINITPDESSHQHNLLVNLAKRGHEVYYVAPIFHDTRELDLHRSAEQIMAQSIWVPAGDLHRQQRGDRSYITYLPDGTCTLHPGGKQIRRSEPRYEFPEGTAVTRRIDRDYYASLQRDLEGIIAQETGQEPDYRDMDLRSRGRCRSQRSRNRLAILCSTTTKRIPNGDGSRPSTISSSFEVQGEGHYGVR